MIARSLDVYVLLKLAVQIQPWIYAHLSKELHMSASELHASVLRSRQCGLLMPDALKVRRKPFLDYLIYGVRYAFPSIRGPLQKGVATSHAASPLKELFAQNSEVIPVWPDIKGPDYGYSIEPLHPRAPLASANNPAFRELLVLVDAIRDGRARERNAAASLLEDRLLKHHGPISSPAA